MDNRLYAGVDYHKKWSYVTVLDEGGSVVKEGRIMNSRDNVTDFFTELCLLGHVSAVLEASRAWYVMYEWLEDVVDRVALAHPLKVKAIAEARIKTDKIDAGILAHLLRTDLLPVAYVASRSCRDVRNVLRQRMFFVRVRTMVKNRIWDIVDRYPELAKQRPCADLFAGQGLAWLGGVRLRPVDQRLLAEHVNVYEGLMERIGTSNDLIAELAQGREDVTLLRSIPGIGTFFSVLIASEVDDIRRFPREKNFCSYAGIIPSTRASGGKTYHGRITKQGNKYLRWAFIEAVWPAIRSNGNLRSYFERVAAKKGANRAKVAVGRKIASLAYRTLKRKIPYGGWAPGNPSSQLGG